MEKNKYNMIPFFIYVHKSVHISKILAQKSRIRIRSSTGSPGEVGRWEAGRMK